MQAREIETDRHRGIDIIGAVIVIVVVVVIVSIATIVVIGRICWCNLIVVIVID